MQHPLEWVGRARSRGWNVLLDATAFVPSNDLDLSQVRPDFVALSFYKMFGYPTGVGALIARRQTLGMLRRPWFAGGTITFNLQDASGRAIGHREIEQRAARQRIFAADRLLLQPGSRRGGPGAEARGAGVLL